MGLDDSIGNKTEDLGGEAKDATGRGEFPSVAEAGPRVRRRVCGRGLGGLGMNESFAAFAVVKGPRRPVGANAGQRRHVEHAAQSTVVPFRSV